MAKNSKLSKENQIPKPLKRVLTDLKLNIEDKLPRNVDVRVSPMNGSRYKTGTGTDGSLYYEGTARQGQIVTGAIIAGRVKGKLYKMFVYANGFKNQTKLDQTVKRLLPRYGT